MLIVMKMPSDNIAQMHRYANPTIKFTSKKNYAMLFKPNLSIYTNI